jgi:general secretion pathway protein A
MYTEFYRFTSKPFSIVPNPDCLYMTSKHQLALTYLQYGISENLGFILLTGDIGTGKTTLIRHILRQIGTNMEVAVIFNTQISPSQLIEMILSEFELQAESGNKSKNLDLLNDFLIARYMENRKVIIIIDEAQNLSREVLEEVRMLSNLQSESRMLVQVMLVGQPELKTKIKSPELAQLTQRIAVNYHLGPLSREETARYIAFRLGKAGGDPELFTPESMDMIHACSGGVPRSINLLCDAALVYGFADELTRIETPVIEQVVADKGGIGVAPTTDPSEKPSDSGNEEQTPNEAWTNRLTALERQVEKLSLQIQWQIREIEDRATSFKDSLITSLKEQIIQERSRTDMAEARYLQAKERYLVLKRELTSLKKYHEPPPYPERLTPAARPSENPSPPSRNHFSRPTGWQWCMGSACMLVMTIAGIVFFRTY